MARNEEKAMNLFNKWTTFKKDFHAVGTNRRPLVAAECDSVGDAEKWRRELVRDITKKIASIQNANLGEFRIRELNDEINKLQRQKHYWEMRIRELGGTDFRKGRQIYDVEGKELPGAPGYKYYGAAKDLPGVRELFAEEVEEREKVKAKRSRAELGKGVSPDYYGFRDDDDGALVPKEAEMERRLIAKSMKEFETKRAALSEEVKRSGGVYGTAELAELMYDEAEEIKDEEHMAKFLGAVQIPAQNITDSIDAVSQSGSLGSNGSNVGAAVSQGELDLKAALLEQKKMSLIGKYL